MKFYNSVGPNPHIVRIYIAEKGLDIPVVEVDLIAAENRGEEHMKRNPSGQMPALELDDGTFISEVTAICEYLEELNPTPSLVGATPAERAETRMWLRKVDLAICEPMGTGFRAGEAYGMFKDRVCIFPEQSDPAKKVGQHYLGWLNNEMEGKEFLCGDRLTLADIHLFGFLDFGMNMAAQPINPEHTNILAWYERMKARPSSSA